MKAKIAIVHDWLTNFGGAEKVVLKLHEMFPEAPIYTLVYNKKIMEKYFKGIDIRTSFIQKMPFGVKMYKSYLPLMPLAIEQFDLSEYDIIISSSWCVAKGVNVKADTKHICYCHTPMRYAWDLYHEYNKGNIIKRSIIAQMMHKLRMWDYISSNRVDYFIANSKNIANRINKHYRREAEVIYPPIDNFFFENVKSETNDNGYYLLITRLVPYKKADLIVEAFNELGLPLVVIGNGPEKEKIVKSAKSNITFKQDLTDEEVKSHYDNCKAFIFMAEEDFGMVMAEAEACGKPVIAYSKGGAAEIVTEETGILVNEQTKEALKEAVLKMEKSYKNFDSNKIRKEAEKFNEKNFIEKIKRIVEKEI